MLAAESMLHSPLNLLYYCLFHPIATFQSIAAEYTDSENVKSEKGLCNNFLIFGAVIVFCVSAIAPVIQCILKGGSIETLIFMIPASAVSGVFLWLLMGGIIAVAAFACSSKTHYKNFLTLSALATTPWLLMPSLALIKINLGLFGNILGTLLIYLLWGWTTYLFAAAIGITYRMSAERVLIILFLPFVFAWVTFFWMLGFFGNLYLFAP